MTRLYLSRCHTHLQGRLGLKLWAVPEMGQVLVDGLGEKLQNCLLAIRLEVQAVHQQALPVRLPLWHTVGSQNHQAWREMCTPAMSEGKLAGRLRATMYSKTARRAARALSPIDQASSKAGHPRYHEAGPAVPPAGVMHRIPSHAACSFGVWGRQSMP